MGMYKEEEVPTDKVDYRDNSKCVELIEGKPFSLVSKISIRVFEMLFCDYIQLVLLFPSDGSS